MVYTKVYPSNFIFSLNWPTLTPALGKAQLDLHQFKKGRLIETKNVNTIWPT